jgi:hypothetical protein
MFSNLKCQHGQAIFLTTPALHVVRRQRGCELVVGLSLPVAVPPGRCQVRQARAHQRWLSILEGDVDGDGDFVSHSVTQCGTSRWRQANSNDGRRRPANSVGCGTAPRAK